MPADRNAEADRNLKLVQAYVAKKVGHVRQLRQLSRETFRGSLYACIGVARKYWDNIDQTFTCKLKIGDVAIQLSYEGKWPMRGVCEIRLLKGQKFRKTEQLGLGMKNVFLNNDRSTIRLPIDVEVLPGGRSNVEKPVILEVEDHQLADAPEAAVTVILEYDGDQFGQTLQEHLLNDDWNDIDQVAANYVVLSETLVGKV